jgi:hypothetical protein
MKAQAFLELVDRTLTAQQDYFAARRKQAGVITTQELLIKSKELEKQCRAVIAEGRLEPDEPAAEVFTTDEYQEQLRLMNETDLQYRLDFPDSLRPTEYKGDTQSETQN